MKTKAQIKKEIRDLLVARISDEQDRIALHEVVRAAIEKREGKPITKHLETAVKKNLVDGAVVTLSKEHGMYHLYIWNIPAFPTHEDRMSMFLGFHGYGDDDVCSIEKFEDYDTCNGNAAWERVWKYQADLEPERLENLASCVYVHESLKAKLVAARNDFVAQFESSSDPGCSAIARAFHIKV